MHSRQVTPARRRPPTTKDAGSSMCITRSRVRGAFAGVPTAAADAAASAALRREKAPLNCHAYTRSSPGGRRGKNRAASFVLRAPLMLFAGHTLGPHNNRLHPKGMSQLTGCDDVDVCDAQVLGLQVHRPWESNAAWVDEVSGSQRSRSRAGAAPMHAPKLRPGSRMVHPAPATPSPRTCCRRGCRSRCTGPACAPQGRLQWWRAPQSRRTRQD